MKTITTKTATEERNAVMGDYAIQPISTGWTLSERNEHTIFVSQSCHTRRQARAMWLSIFEDENLISGFRKTDEALLQLEAEFLAS